MCFCPWVQEQLSLEQTEGRCAVFASQSHWLPVVTLRWSLESTSISLSVCKRRSELMFTQQSRAALTWDACEAGMSAQGRIFKSHPLPAFPDVTKLTTSNLKESCESSKLSIWLKEPASNDHASAWSVKRRMNSCECSFSQMIFQSGTSWKISAS